MADEQKTTSTDPATSIESFAITSISVALDCTPGSDGDYLFEQYGVLASDIDESDERIVRITIDDGRRFLVTVDVSEIKEG